MENFLLEFEDLFNVYLEIVFQIILYLSVLNKIMSFMSLEQTNHCLPSSSGLLVTKTQTVDNKFKSFTLVLVH